MNYPQSGPYLLRALRILKFTADAAIIAAIGILLVLFSLQFPHSAKVDSMWLVTTFRQWGDPSLAWVASKFGWVWPPGDFSLLPIGVGFVLLACKLGWDALMVPLIRFIRKQLPKTEKSLGLSASDSSQGISVSSTLLALAEVSEKAMAKIQRRYVRVGQKLDHTQHRHCAFLSIGVLDPVEMKQGADPEKVDRSFKAYEQMLEETFKLTGAWKEAWTPEGVMVCYLDVRNALDAAQRVLKGLEGFNAKFDELPHPFRIGCGINEGDVAIFEDSKLQKVSDRVIDVAGHMQKNASPNTVWLSSEILEHLGEKPGFHPAPTQVDGCNVVEWRA